MTDYDDDAPTNVQGTPTPPGRPLSQDQKSAIAAALVGTAALGGAAYGMSRYLDDSEISNQTTPGSGSDMNPQADPNQVPGPDSGVTNVSNAETNPNLNGGGTSPDDPLVSEVDRDGMTFAEAFREARDEMGPAHYFEWHGQLYNTYYKEEWDAMSPGEHQTFLASVYGDETPGSGPGDMLAGGEIPSSPDVPAAADEVPPADPDITIDEPGTGTPVVAVSNTQDAPDITVDESAYAMGDAAPTIDRDADTAVAQLDGHQVVVYDIDHDDRPDAILIDEKNVILIDTDHDHILDTAITYDPDSQKVVDVQAMDQLFTIDGSMNILHQSDTHGEGTLADEADLGSDFNNNDDIGEYAV